jgi:hypothetical protein
MFHVSSKLLNQLKWYFPQGCLNDLVLVANLSKIIDNCQPPMAYQSSYY